MESISLPMLTEESIRSFLREAPRPLQKWSVLLGTLVPAALIAAVVFLVLNGQSYLRLNQPLDNTTTPTAVATVTAIVPPFVAASIPTAAPTATPAPTPDIPSIPNNTVSFQALGISAPVAWSVPFDEKTILSDLETGVVNIAGTAHPGQTGYTIVTGHSSNYIWDKGQYNTIFAPLSKAKLGQEILASYNNKVYTYKISKIFTVKPSEVGVLTSDPQKSGIRLITCTPVGTSLNRLVVQAEQVSPDPSQNQTFTPQISGSSIPDAR